MPTRTAYRIFFGLLVLLSSSTLTAAAVSNQGTSADFENQTGEEVMAGDQQVVAPRNGITVVATDSNSWLGDGSEGPRARAELVAFAPNGSILYYNDSHTRYWDVDPVPGTEATVEYMYADHLNASECPTDWNLSQRRVDEETWQRYQSNRVSDDISACTRNGFERVNLTTDEVTARWSQVTPGKEATRYHDADRVNETYIAIADIYLDRVFLVNTETGRTTWTWNASDAFDPQHTGGPYPEDWSHINDIETLEDGRIMVSVRNHDRVVFLNRSTGVLEEWTLGEEDNYGILYEQHNPDYINSSNGGPVAVISDSENNRVVEYQRENGEWTRTWTWRDAQMQWPRDADRLPNGNTLITDSNGNRVFEVNQRGKVIWSVQIAFPYEAERLETGDESTNGPSATTANLESDSGGLGAQFWITSKNLLPGKYLNGLMYVTPTWIGLPQLTAVAVLFLSLGVWAVIEVYWRVGDRASERFKRTS